MNEPGEQPKPQPSEPEAATPEATVLEQTDGQNPVSFAEAAQEEQPGLLREFFDFLMESKAWWLTPIVIVLLLVGALIFLSGTAAAPFIYTLF